MVILQYWLLIVIGSIVTCSANLLDDQKKVSIYYVTPDGNVSSDKCSDGDICHPLSYYLEFQQKYFTSNKIFMFIEGTHTANYSLTATSVGNLTLKAQEEYSVVTCGENIGFEFYEARNLVIEKLTFYNCGNEMHNHTALFFLDGFDLNLTEVTILKYGRDSNFTILKYGLNITNVFGKVAIYSTKSQQGSVILYNKCAEGAEIRIENCYFSNGTKQPGLHIQTNCTSTNITIINTTMAYNSGGNLALNILKTPKHPITIYKSSFANGEAEVGAGLFVKAKKQYCNDQSSETTTIVHIISSNFTFNYASKVGGAIYMKLEEFETQCVLSVIKIEKCVFQSNSIGKKGHGGIAFHVVNFATARYSRRSEPQFSLSLNECKFLDNYLKENDQNAAGSGALMIQGSPSVYITDSIIENNNSSGIVAVNSILIFKGTVTIARNNGSTGGGILLSQNSQIYFSPHTEITIANNNAQHAGGGIYVDNENIQAKPPCFFQIHEDIAKNLSLLETVKVYFVNNSAIFAGHALYGGSIEYCHFILDQTTTKQLNTSVEVFNTFFHIEPHKDSYISSNPQKVCLCNESSRSFVQCNITGKIITSYPGEVFTSVYAAVVGQVNGIRPGGITAKFTDVSKENALLGKNQHEQSISSIKCEHLQYSIYTNESNAKLSLTAQQGGDTSIVDYLREYRPLYIRVVLKACPLGFEIQNHIQGYQCVGVKVLLDNNIMCNISEQTINRPEFTWIGYIQNTSNKSGYVVFHTNCPRDYCKPGNQRIKTSATSFNQDIQCAFSRTGILCGACSGNLSVVLGTSNCEQCTNFYLFLIPLFALLGILLVVVLTVLNLTVTEGTIHGLIFYSNIVQINSENFFPTITANSKVAIFLKMFLGWINLDVGFQTCLYNGMDALDKAILQFVFPVYIWIISGAIIYLSRKSSMVARLAGKNAVKVLATLILLSYAKLLRAVLNAFYFVVLQSKQGEYVKDNLVWGVDGNVHFLKGKHIVLFLVALFIGLISLPYAGVLLFIQPLQNHAQWKICCYIRRLVPFFDACTGAYNDRVRFWPGLLLTIRILLFVGYAINVTDDRGLDMTITIIASLVLLTLGFFLRHGIYKRWYLDLLESIFLMNLVLLCSVTLYTLQSEQKRLCTTCVSVGITLMLFIGIISFHVYRKVSGTNCWKYLVAELQMQRNRLVGPRTKEVNDTEGDDDDDSIMIIPPFRRFDEEREPLLSLTD